MRKPHIIRIGDGYALLRADTITVSNFDRMLEDLAARWQTTTEALRLSTADGVTTVATDVSIDTPA